VINEQVQYFSCLADIFSCFLPILKHGEHEKPRGSHRMMPSTGVKITTIISFIMVIPWAKCAW
ncbi:hypothetical protein, partial [Enterobacter hormaechei]|uniref:hypothetical protein n=1 Tax=Enterobacter hormaechei TaxID=158836 RepID=UPI002877B9E1